MRCREVEELIIEGTLNKAAQDHVAACPRCQALARDATALHAGFELLAIEAVPEPSWGFMARVLRRLDDSPAHVGKRFEVIGRRAVYAAGALAMTILVAVALSSSGPVRGSGQGSFSLTRAESYETPEVLLAGGVEEYEELNLLPIVVNGGESR